MSEPGDEDELWRDEFAPSEFSREVGDICAKCNGTGCWPNDHVICCVCGGSGEVSEGQ